MATISGVIMTLCGILILLNWASLITAIVKEQSTSFAPPFLCGVLGFFAGLAYPDARVSHFSWLFLLADPSIAAVGMILLKSFKKKLQRIK